MEHLDLVAGVVAVLGKGDGERELLTLPHETAVALRAWIDVRGEEPGPLFVNFDRAGKGRRLTATSVYRMVRQLGERAGVRYGPTGSATGRSRCTHDSEMTVRFQPHCTGNPAQFRMTAERELFCRDCGRQVAFTPAFPCPGSLGPPSPDPAPRSSG
jgi:hypothetical protein